MQLSRRSVLKGIAAAMMCPTIQLRPSVPDERLLLPFCDPDATRYNFEAPFGYGSLTYATDSRAMIRCELANRQEIGERRLPKNIDETWSKWFRPKAQWRPLTLEDIQPTESNDYAVCFECGDRRISLGDAWPELNKWGEPEDKRLKELGWDVDDNTIRDDACHRCRGRCVGHVNVTVMFGHQHQAHQLKRILALPNPMVCASGFEPAEHAQCLLFRADGFEGIALGLYDRAY